MGLSASSLSSVVEGGKSADLVEMLSLMADPVAFQAKVTELRKATEDTKVEMDLVIPAKEIKALRTAAEEAAADAQSKADQVNARITDALERARDLVAQTLADVNEKVKSIIADADAAVKSANELREAAAKERSAASAKLATLINEFVQKGADAAAAKAAAEKDAADAKEAKMAAEAARDDFLARIGKINAIAAG